MGTTDVDMIDNFVVLQLKEEEVKVSQHDVASLPFSNFELL
jgi:hypothetical protein